METFKLKLRNVDNELLWGLPSSIERTPTNFVLFLKFYIFPIHSGYNIENKTKRYHNLHSSHNKDRPIS